MQQPLSQAERAIRDTLIGKAGGAAHDLLSDLYGLPRMPAIGRQHWRRLMHGAALGPRDRMGTVFEAVRALLEPWASLTETLCNLRIATPSKLLGGTPAGEAWSCTHTHRLVEVSGHGVYWTVSLDGADIDLCPITTTYWRGARWTADEDDVAVKVLPFWLREEGAIVSIYVDADLFGVPASYLQPDAGARPEGQPAGGAVLENAQINAALPGPLYLAGEGLGGVLRALLDSLCAAGVRLNLLSYTWCTEYSLNIGHLSDLRVYGRPVLGGTPIPIPLEGWSP